MRGGERFYLMPYDRAKSIDSLIKLQFGNVSLFTIFIAMLKENTIINYYVVMMAEYVANKWLN